VAPEFLEYLCASIIINVFTERYIKTWSVLSCSFFPSVHAMIIYVELNVELKYTWKQKRKWSYCFTDKL